MRLPLAAPELAIIGAGALWGLLWIPLRYLEEIGTGPLWSMLGTFSLSLLLLLPFILRRRIHFFSPGLLITGFCTGSSFVLYSMAVVLTDVVSAILLFYLSPVWATLLGRMLLAERFTPARIVALIMGLAGLWVVLGADGRLPLPRNIGDWCGLAGGVAWALGSLRAHQDTAVSSMAQTLALFIGGTCAGGIILWLDIAPEAIPIPDPKALLVVAFLAMLTIVSTLGVLWGVKAISPGRAALLLLFEVLVGVASAAAFANEAFGWRQIIGSALILAAALAEVRPQSKDRIDPPSPSGSRPADR
ncbi:DMT family transporter [Thioalkalivibrio sp. HK1]|uniref:DMT family transporter n=1 Tax=Thioalkalivibrio sp. HK1 TaxID=1469245 RepID=UPI00046E6FE2|nr:DMT family transporter [Thioalkalivibrio sp. HK1]